MLAGKARKPCALFVVYYMCVHVGVLVGGRGGAHVTAVFVDEQTMHA